MILTKHFIAMLAERQIRREWVDNTVQCPDKVEDREDGTRHYLKRIENQGGRWLRVITSTTTEPHKAITVFFDRRIRTINYENQSR